MEMYKYLNNLLGNKSSLSLLSIEELSDDKINEIIDYIGDFEEEKIFDNDELSVHLTNDILLDCITVVKNGETDYILVNNSYTENILFDIVKPYITHFIEFMLKDSNKIILEQPQRTGDVPELDYIQKLIKEEGTQNKGIRVCEYQSYILVENFNEEYNKSEYLIFKNQKAFDQEF